MKVTDKITITNEDNMELMARYPDNYFDLAIVDPPYGINADKKNSGKKLQSKKSSALSKDYGNQEWDSDVPDINYFKELFRVSKEQIIWGINYYPYDFLSGGRIYWDKCVTMPTYSDGELALCSKLNSIKSFKFAWHGMIQQDMKNKEVRIHPTQKPRQLYNWLLDNYAKEGDKILDTHLGSGSIALACHERGFELTACELDKDYYDSAIKKNKEPRKPTKTILMEAFKELQYKSNYKFIFEFLQDLQQKSLDKNNVKFANDVQAIKNMVEENWSQSIENVNEIRALNDVIREMEIFILENKES